MAGDEGGHDGLEDRRRRHHPGRGDGATRRRWPGCSPTPPPRRLEPPRLAEAALPRRRGHDPAGHPVAWCVESEGPRILVDTCVGHRAIPGIDGLSGPADFPDRLAGAGFPVESIDVVCCTHLHFDHVGWNTRLEGGRWVPDLPERPLPVLPPRVRALHRRAERLRPQPRRHGAAGRRRGPGRPGRADPPRSPTRSAWCPPPATPPATSASSSSPRGEQALITGDATHHPVQWAEPDWGMTGDFDGAVGAESRRRLRAEHGGQGTLVIGTHYAAPSAGLRRRRAATTGASRSDPAAAPSGDRGQPGPREPATMGELHDRRTPRAPEEEPR